MDKLMMVLSDPLSRLDVLFFLAMVLVGPFVFIVATMVRCRRGLRYVEPEGYIRIAVASVVILLIPLLTTLLQIFVFLDISGARTSGIDTLEGFAGRAAIGLFALWPVAVLASWVLAMSARRAKGVTAVFIVGAIGLGAYILYLNLNVFIEESLQGDFQITQWVLIPAAMLGGIPVTAVCVGLAKTLYSFLSRRLPADAAQSAEDDLSEDQADEFPEESDEEADEPSRDRELPPPLRPWRLAAFLLVVMAACVFSAFRLNGAIEKRTPYISVAREIGEYYYPSRAARAQGNLITLTPDRQVVRGPSAEYDRWTRHWDEALRLATEVGSFKAPLLWKAETGNMDWDERPGNIHTLLSFTWLQDEIDVDAVQLDLLDESGEVLHVMSRPAIRRGPVEPGEYGSIFGTGGSNPLAGLVHNDALLVTIADEEYLPPEDDTKWLKEEISHVSRDNYDVLLPLTPETKTVRLRLLWNGGEASDAFDFDFGWYGSFVRTVNGSREALDELRGVLAEDHNRQYLVGRCLYEMGLFEFCRPGVNDGNAYDLLEKASLWFANNEDNVIWDAEKRMWRLETPPFPDPNDEVRDMMTDGLDSP
jgi:hypothetical protein